MSNKYRKLYNPELGREEEYLDVYKDFIETVKGEKVVVYEHFLKDKDGELWVDFNNPNENLYKAFDAYRKHMNFLSPNDIRKIREKYNLTVREFASSLGMGAGTLSSIENNKRLQNKEQNALLFLAMHADAYKDLIISETNTELSNNIDLINNLQKIGTHDLLN